MTDVQLQRGEERAFCFKPVSMSLVCGVHLSPASFFPLISAALQVKVAWKKNQEPQASLSPPLRSGVPTLPRTLPVAIQALSSFPCAGKTTATVIFRGSPHPPYGPGASVVGTVNKEARACGGAPRLDRRGLAMLWAQVGFLGKSNSLWSVSALSPFAGPTLRTQR